MVTLARRLHLDVVSRPFPTISFGRPKQNGEPAMQLKEAYLERVVAEVEDLAERVAVLKARIAKQKISLTLEPRSELEDLRNRFRDFKRRVEQLEEASEENLEEARKASELAGRDVQRALGALLSALPAQTAE
jgi:predicted nuclease with TOPRIM domain